MGNYIRFDWAIKRLLRDKANFAVLEGFLTTLLGMKLTISRLLESEGNQEREYSKFNRVDLLAENTEGELFLIEVQNNNEYAYFQRMLFGASKLVTEYIKYINRGDNYDKVRKVYSVNVVYFPLGGHGCDVVYHGKTEFLGLTTGEKLDLSPYQKQLFRVDEVSQLYPEYYVLKVNDFNSVARTPLEEWIYYLKTGDIPESASAPGYLKTGDIPESASAPGLAQARERLRLDTMSEGERRAYYSHIDDIVSLQDTIVNSRRESFESGKAEGRKEGLAEGREEGLTQGWEEGEHSAHIKIARKMKSKGTPLAEIAELTGVSEGEIEKL